MPQIDPGQVRWDENFDDWYSTRARRWGLSPDPDAPEHQYDYRAAYQAKAEPDESGHWPSEFKMAGHPNLIVEGIDTRTGQVAINPEEVTWDATPDPGTMMALPAGGVMPEERQEVIPGPRPVVSNLEIAGQMVKDSLFGELPKGLGYLQKPVEEAIDYWGKYTMSKEEEMATARKYPTLMAARYAAASLLLPGVSEYFASTVDWEEFQKKPIESQRLEILGTTAAYVTFGAATKWGTEALAALAKSHPWMTKPIIKALTESNWFRRISNKERGIVTQTIQDMKTAGLNDAQILKNLRNRNKAEYQRFKEEAIKRRAVGEVREEIPVRPTEPITPEPQRLTPKEVKEVVWEKPIEEPKRVTKQALEEYAYAPSERIGRKLPTEVAKKPPTIEAKPKEVVKAELKARLAASMEAEKAKIKVPTLKEPGGIPNFTERAKVNKTNNPTLEAYRWAKDATKEQYETLKKEHAKEGERLQKLSEEVKKAPKGPEQIELLKAKSPREFERSFKGEALEAWDEIHGVRVTGKREPIEAALEIKLSEVKPKAEVVKAKIYESEAGKFVRVAPGPSGNWTFYKIKNLKERGQRVKTRILNKFYGTKEEAQAALDDYATRNRWSSVDTSEIPIAAPKKARAPKIAEIPPATIKERVQGLWQNFNEAEKATYRQTERLPERFKNWDFEVEELAELGRIAKPKKVVTVAKPKVEEITEAVREYPEEKPPAKEVKKYIRMMAEEVKEGEPPVTIKYEGEYGKPEYKRLPSSYHEFMVKKGWTGKEVVRALEKGVKGEKLGVKQQVIYDAATEYAETRYRFDEATLETFPGFQKMYEAVAKGQEVKVRARVEAIRKEYLTPVKGNPLDKGAIEFLKSEKYKDYVKEMPGIGELSPKEIFKYDPEAKKLIATIETKGGELKPAIRQSGYHALKEFADSFEGARDISKLSASWTDPTRMIQEIDQGKFRGMAQKHVLWPSRMSTLAKLKWQDLRKGELAVIQEKYNVGSGKKARAIGDVIEYIGTEAVKADVPVENLLSKPKVQGFLKGFKPKVKAQIIEAAKELRTFSDKLLDAQNIPRKIRKQKEIPKRAFYRTWIMETNLWSKLLGQKIRPEEIMEKPTMPDFIFPNQPFNPRAEARTGLMAKYPKERNIFRLLTDYVDSAGKDIFDTNIVHNNKIHAAVLRSKGLENAAEGINRWTAEVFAGVDPRLTRWAKETVPPRLRKGILAIRRNLTRAVFPLNWTWNLFIQTSSAGITYARYGTKANLAGLKYFLSPTTRRSVKQNAYSYILKSRWGGKAHYQDVQKSISRNKRLEARPIEKVEDFLNYLTSAFEDGLTGHAVAAAYSKGKSLGLKGRELWEYASEGGAKTQSMYNYGDVPGMLRAREVGAIAPFQTFGFEVFNTIREMNFPGVRRLIGKTGLYETLSADSIAGKALMSKRLKMLARWVVAIAITDMVGEAAIGRKPWVISSFMPFIGYIVGGYAGRGPVPHQYMQDAKKGIKDVLVYGDFKRLRKWVMRYHVIAGVQLERMIEGLEAVSKGQVTDIRGRTLFRLEPEDYLKAITMGPYRTEPGKEYIRKRRGKVTLRDAHQTIQ